MQILGLKRVFYEYSVKGATMKMKTVNVKCSCGATFQITSPGQKCCPGCGKLYVDTGLGLLCGRERKSGVVHVQTGDGPSE